ncbi:hsp70 nucleotide exchange factor fes1 [Coemansia sp. RSA 1813]|nr:hsp70 nucleotide exchange factor fes1 [Coemansia sp. RSA 1646]KAJ1773394.1 hsp70 nucleotide exchange factor fes1 [Coemansia sp. RSA 1843]KAJ2212398.1 hsp70 nucleotide exchange factor fes1 [Coemansia sp. RSA 487]KAJ2572188.1 hsp70 nucleotide exchange factor fes1 [Coemansia sp. RSA 1813]
MDALLKWAILNGATANEDAPATTRTGEPPKKLDPAVIDAILGRPASEQMTECMDSVEHADTPLEAKEVALDDLEMLVENIDNACNLGPLNMWPRLIARYTDAEPAVRSGVLWVSGTAVQHNPKAQQAFSKAQGLEAALRVLGSDPVTSVRTKALYCVSSFIRGNVQGLTEFIANSGLSTLMLELEEVKGDAGKATALRQKSFFLLRSLIEEALDAETPEELRPGMYLPNAVAELGFVDTTAAVLGKMLEENDPEGSTMVFEQIAGFLLALGATDNGKKAINECKALPGAVTQMKTRFDLDTSELDTILS